MSEQESTAKAQDKRPAFAPAAHMLTWGLVLLILGQFIFNAGQMSALQAAMRRSILSSSSSGSPGLTIGALMSIIGLIMLVAGVWRLASHIDRLARHLYRP
jgi:hypothetical protein